MVITISVVATCAILVGLNIYLAVRDHFDKKDIALTTRRKISRLGDDQLDMGQDIVSIKQDLLVMKKNIEALRVDIVRLTSKPQGTVDTGVIEARLAEVERQTQLALMSAQTIQNNFLQHLDAQDK